MADVRQTEFYARWVAKLKDQTARARILERIRRLSLDQYGDVKAIGEAVFEIRIDYGPGYRVYFTKMGSKIVLLLCGGDKSSQSRDIQRAKVIARRVRDIGMEDRE